MYIMEKEIDTSGYTIRIPNEGEPIYVWNQDYNYKTGELRYYLIETKYKDALLEAVKLGNCFYNIQSAINFLPALKIMVELNEQNCKLIKRIEELEKK